VDSTGVWNLFYRRYTINTMTEKLISEEPDWIVSQVMKRMSERSIQGIEKYNCTMMREDVSTKEWIDHAIEEALDLAVYLERLKYNLERGLPA